MSPDLLIAVAQAVLTGNALLMLAHATTYVPRIASVSMTLALVLLAVGLFLIPAPISVAVAAVGAVAWLGIFLLRGENLARRVD